MADRPIFDGKWRPERKPFDHRWWLVSYSEGGKGRGRYVARSIYQKRIRGRALPEDFPSEQAAQHRADILNEAASR